MYLERGSASKSVNETLTVTIHSTSGIVIGKGGQEVDKIKEELKTTKKMYRSIFSRLNAPELDAQLVGEELPAIEARISFRRAMKTSIASTMNTGR